MQAESPHHWRPISEGARGSLDERGGLEAALLPAQRYRKPADFGRGRPGRGARWLVFLLRLRQLQQGAGLKEEVAAPRTGLCGT
jgi:hypothetical protein